MESSLETGGDCDGRTGIEETRGTEENFEQRPPAPPPPPPVVNFRPMQPEISFTCLGDENEIEEHVQVGSNYLLGLIDACVLNAYRIRHEQMFMWKII